MEKCFFPWCQRHEKGIKLSTWTEKRIDTVRNVSKQRGDDIESRLENHIKNGNGSDIRAHHLCTSEYVDKSKIKRVFKLNSTETANEPSTSKSTCRSSDSFSFKQHCIFCGKNCSVDKKHPNRRRVVICQTVDYGKQAGGFKEAILEACDKRQDQHSEDVKLRVLSATSDLHAADARYRKDCRDKFMISSVLTKVNVDEHRNSASKNQEAVDNVVQMMESHINQVWTLIELYDIYTEHYTDSNVLCKRKFGDHLSDVLGSTLIVLHSPGLASILMFRSKATEVIKLVEEESDRVDLKPVAKQIVDE